MHGSGLNAIVDFRLHEAHRGAFSQLTELRVPQCVAVEIDFAAIQALDKTIAIIAQLGDATFGWRGMELRLALPATVLILKSASCGIEWHP